MLRIRSVVQELALASDDLYRFISDFYSTYLGSGHWFVWEHVRQLTGMGQHWIDNLVAWTKRNVWLGPYERATILLLHRLYVLIQSLYWFSFPMSGNLVYIFTTHFHPLRFLPERLFVFTRVSTTWSHLVNAHSADPHSQSTHKTPWTS